MQKEWLVEIRVKDWIVPINNLPRVITYEQVLAEDEYYARHRAYEQFEQRTKFEPIMKRKFAAYGISLVEVCAPDAVEI